MYYKYIHRQCTVVEWLRLTDMYNIVRLIFNLYNYGILLNKITEGIIN